MGDECKPPFSYTKTGDQIIDYRHIHTHHAWTNTRTNIHTHTYVQTQERIQIHSKTSHSKNVHLLVSLIALSSFFSFSLHTPPGYLHLCLLPGPFFIYSHILVVICIPVGSGPGACLLPPPPASCISHTLGVNVLEYSTSYTFFLKYNSLKESELIVVIWVTTSISKFNGMTLSLNKGYLHICFLQKYVCMQYTWRGIHRDHGLTLSALFSLLKRGKQWK